MKKKVALVTGGSRGIGSGIAVALAKLKWTVVINYLSNRMEAEKTLARVKKAGGDGFCLPSDIANLDLHENLVSSILNREGRIDLLINNAGMAPANRTDILQVSPESYDEVMNTNLRGPFFLTQRVASAMIKLVEKHKETAPKIINIGSISSAAATITRGEYCISKAGLSMMTNLWAARLAEYGIHVYEIRPGITETDMTLGVKEKYDRLIAEGLTLIPRWGKPEDIGKAVTAIAENLLPYSTGETIHVDGGFHVSRL